MESKNKKSNLFSHISLRDLRKEATKSQLDKLKELQLKDTTSKVLVVSFVFLFIYCFFVVSDIFTNFYARSYSHINLISEMVLGVASIIMILVHSISKHIHIKRFDIIVLIYYLVIECCILLFLSSDLLRGYDNSTNAFYMLIVLSIFALYPFWFNFILISFVSVGALVVITMFSNYLSWMSYQHPILIIILSGVCMNFFRIHRTKLFYENMKLEEMTIKLKDMSTIDFLTKVKNRTALNSFLKEQIINTNLENRKLFMYMMDIDDFKSYNDYYSHISGDLCLHSIGKLLKSFEDDSYYAFRFGGEEFLIIGLDINKEDGIAFINNVFQKTRELNIERNDEVNNMNYVSVSIGCSYGVVNGLDDYQNLLKKADNQLYKAKKNGKNCVYFNETKIIQ